MSTELVHTPTGPTAEWFAAMRNHAREHGLAALGLAIGMLAVLALLAQSLWQVLAGEAAGGLRYAMIGGAAGFATARTARKLFPLVEKANDQPGADLLTQCIEVHEKAAWMLRSLLED